MLKQLFSQCRNQAAILLSETGIDYSTCKVDVLADGYCKACDEHDERNKDLYISALLLRFWYAIKKLQDKSPIMGTDVTEFFNWLYEAIEYACKYRAWQDPTKKVNAQQAIRQCIETIRLQHYYQSNLKKHKANFAQYSLDNNIAGDEDDTARTYLDTYEDEDVAAETEAAKSEDNARSIVQLFIDRKKIVEAIILDTIAFNDTQKSTISKKTGYNEAGEEYEYKSTTYSFWEFKAIQALNNLPADYVDYFLDNYRAKREIVEACVNKIRTSTNQKLYTYLRACLAYGKAALTKEGY